MRNIIQILRKLFKSASRVSARAGKGLLQHGTGRYAVKAVQSLDITVRGVRIAYKELNEFDKAAVDEVVEYAVRFAYEYIDHHDEHTPYRINASTLDEVVMSHAEEITQAAERALHSRLRSHGYDLVAGKSQRVAIFQDEDVRKQVIIAVIRDVCDHIEEEAELTS